VSALALAIVLAVVGPTGPCPAPDSVVAYSVRTGQAVSVTPASARAIRQHPGLRGALRVGARRARPRPGFALYARPGAHGVLLAPGDGRTPLRACSSLGEAERPTLVWAGARPVRLDLLTGLLDP